MNTQLEKMDQRIGMSGQADANKDASISMAELHRFVAGRVKEQAALDGREQMPELVGDSSQILVKLQ